MTEKRQNEVCCEVLGPPWRLVQHDGYWAVQVMEIEVRPFTQAHTYLHVLRAAVIEASKHVEFIAHLDIEENWRDSPSRWTMAMMQATPTQQVEAALRALGLWEDEAKEDG